MRFDAKTSMRAMAAGGWQLLIYTCRNTLDNKIFILTKTKTRISCFRCHLIYASPKQGLTRSSRIAQPTRMQVVVRVRPPTKTELESGVGNLTFLENSIQVKANATKRQSQVIDEPVIADNTQTRERRFTFDHLFEPSSTQAEVYYSIGQDLVDAALSGINAALMCYGVTGSGKTYSLSNLTPNHEGLVVRCCSHLFNKAAEENTDISISVSYYQIYLEQVYDLLAFEAGETGPQVKSIEQRTKKLSDPKQFIPGLPVRENRDGTVLWSLFPRTFVGQ